MLSRRRNRNRCYVCRQWLTQHIVSVHLFSYSRGWHMVMPLCRPCSKALFGILEEVRSEYQ